MVVSIEEHTYNFSSPQELEALKRFHEVVFSDIISIKGDLILSFETSDQSYLIVPVTVYQFGHPLSCFVDVEVAQDITAAAKRGREVGNLVIPSWPFDWSDKLVFKCYTDERSHDQPQLYEIMSYDPEETPLSPFPGNPEIAFTEYFYEKYGYSFSYYSDSSLTCRPVNMGSNGFGLLASRFNSDMTASSSSRTREIKLFPELCKVWPIPASFWKLCRCIPSILHRLKSFLLTEELSQCVSSMTGIGSTDVYEYRMCSDRREGEEKGGVLGNSQSTFYWRDGGNPIDDITSEQLIQQVHVSGVIRAPSNSLLLQSLTASSARDRFDLERLETLGDSFLKLSMSVNLFCCRSNDHEGKLTQSRVNRISNFNLSYLAEKRGIPALLHTNQFEPDAHWIPPGFHLR